MEIIYYIFFSNSYIVDILLQVQSIFDTREKKILFLGLDNAGKTTILYNLKLHEITTVTVPTIGFNVEEVQLTDNIKITIWDIGGQDKIRFHWRHYYGGTDAVIFIIDSADRDRFHTVRKEIENLLKEPELAKIPFMLLCNKQDLPHHRTAHEIAKDLRVTELFADRPFLIKGVVASEIKIDNFKWLAEVMV